MLFLPDTADYFIQYLKDDKKMFYKNQILQGADAKTLKIISEPKWEAKENHKYETGKRREKNEQPTKHLQKQVQ